jgi:DNA-binding SARP family transcriptional activator
MAEFTVLGPLEARGPAGEVPLGGGATVRVVLAIFVLRAGQPVSRDALVDALWPDDPPPSARQTVESYVSRLRRALREAGLDGAVIEPAAAGYRLVLNGYTVDRDQFEALVAAGRDARSCGDVAAAAARFGEALALWRGPALDGLADRAPLSADAVALNQSRLLVLETWAEARLDLGEAAEVVAALQPEASRNPRRERLHELLMLALYRAGSQAERSSTSRLSGDGSSTSWASSPDRRCARCRSASCVRTRRSRPSRRQWRIRRRRVGRRVPGARRDADGERLPSAWPSRWPRLVRPCGRVVVMGVSASRPSPPARRSSR